MCIVSIACGAIAPTTSVVIVLDGVAHVLLVLLVVLLIISVVVKIVAVNVVSCLERTLALVGAPAPTSRRAALRLTLPRDARSSDRAGCNDQSKVVGSHDALADIFSCRACGGGAASRLRCSACRNCQSFPRVATGLDAEFLP